VQKCMTLNDLKAITNTFSDMPSSKWFIYLLNFVGLYANVRRGTSSTNETIATHSISIVIYSGIAVFPATAWLSCLHITCSYRVFRQSISLSSVLAFEVVNISGKVQLCRYRCRTSTYDCSFCICGTLTQIN